MSSSKTPLHAVALPDGAAEYFAEYIDGDPTAGDWLWAAFEKPGTFYAYVPAHTDVALEGLKYSIQSSLPEEHRAPWRGTRELLLRVLLRLMEGDSGRGILFNDVNLSYGESASSVESSFGHTVRSGSARYHLLDASNASAETLEAGLRATSSIWCSFVAVGDGSSFCDPGRPRGASDETERAARSWSGASPPGGGPTSRSGASPPGGGPTSRSGASPPGGGPTSRSGASPPGGGDLVGFGGSVVFVALEVWDGEGHVFWIADGVLEGEPPEALAR